MRSILFFLTLLSFFSKGAADVTDDIFSYISNKKLSSKRKTELLHFFGNEIEYESEAPFEIDDLPLIYDSIWPFFCLKHLMTDPAICSSWTNEMEPQLEFVKKKSALAYIDKNLILSLGEKLKLIPQMHGDYVSPCDYGCCSACKTPIIRSYALGKNYQMHPSLDLRYNAWILYRCSCLEPGKWCTACVCDTEHHTNCGNYCLDFKDQCPNWKFCLQPSIFPGYFNKSYQTYFSFFQNFLNYQNANKSCKCYWPNHGKAEIISNGVFLIFEQLGRATKMRQAMPAKNFSQYINCDVIEEFARSLLMHAYFYSQYHRILCDVDQFSSNNLDFEDYQLVRQFLNLAQDKMLPYFQKLYSECLKQHPHPKIHYERGMTFFHHGNYVESLDDIREWIGYAEANNLQEFLTSELYLQEGSLLNEMLSYDEAIIALTKSIEKDPENADAYFERAFAYFEKGDFSKALSDYIASGFHPKEIDPKQLSNLNYFSFGQGVTLGIIQGGQDSVTEFVPSLLASLRGMSRGIWACVSSPIAVSHDMIDCAHACLEFIKDTTAKELICKIVPELQECLQKWDQLDDNTKGRYIGYVIGKYGADIFIGAGSIKAIQVYRNLRKANAIMTMETAIVSPKLAEEILTQSTKE